MLSFKNSGAHVTKGINPAGNAALVSEVSADPALVLGPSPANEGAVEDETILGCITTCALNKAFSAPKIWTY